MDQNLPTLKELQARGDPTPGRPLSDEEKALASAQIRMKGNRPGAIGERWAKARLETLLNATVRKREDTLRTYEKDGEWHTFYRPSGYDFDGSATLLVGGSPLVVPLAIEVKTLMDRFSLDRLGDDQRRALNMARHEGRLAMLALVHCVQLRVRKGWLIPWNDPEYPERGRIVDELEIPDWYDIMQMLRLRAQADPRFEGKSIRPKKDWDLLEHCLVEKVSGRWRLCPWLERIRWAGEELQAL